MLGGGTHTFQFTASDGTNSATGDTGIHSGPALPAPPTTEIPTLSPIGLIALVCVLSVIVVISVHVRKRRGTQLLIAAVPALMPIGILFFLFLE